MGIRPIRFKARLSGEEEVPPVETTARGRAKFLLSSDRTKIHFRLTIDIIENVNQAHIHLGERGVNGPVVVWLYPDAPPPVLIPGSFSGVLATGTITAANLVGPLAGMPLSELINALIQGNTYVNVHTTQNPGGEIRGQIRLKR